MKKHLSFTISFIMVICSYGQMSNKDMVFRFDFEINRGDYLFYQDEYFPIVVAFGKPESFLPDSHFTKVAKPMHFERSNLKYGAFVLTSTSEYAYVKTNDKKGWIKYNVPLAMNTKTALRSLLDKPFKTHSQTRKKLGSEFNYLQVTPFSNKNYLLVYNGLEGYSIIDILQMKTTWGEKNFQSVGINYKTDKLEVISARQGKRIIDYYGNEERHKKNESGYADLIDSSTKVYKNAPSKISINEIVENDNRLQIDSILQSSFDIDSIFFYRGYRVSLLGCAALNDNISLMKYLLNNGASVKVKNFNNQAPICFVKSAEAYNLLVQNGASLYMISERNSFLNRRRYPTEEYLYQYPPVLHRIVESAPDSLFGTWEFYEIILRVFIDNNDTIGLQKLYNRGVSFNKPEKQRASRESYQPIFYSKTPDVLKFFVRHGALLTKLDEFGNDAQTKAIQWKDSSLVEWLETRGLPLRKPYNPNFVAITDTSFMSYLLKKGISINSTDRKGRTALIRAGVYDNEQTTARFLLRHGANINITDNRGIKYKSN